MVLLFCFTVRPLTNAKSPSILVVLFFWSFLLGAAFHGTRPVMTARQIDWWIPTIAMMRQPDSPKPNGLGLMRWPKEAKAELVSAPPGNIYTAISFFG